MVRPSPVLQAFAERARALAQGPAPAFSAHERFQGLLEHGLEALADGSYGIAASYVIRGEGLEVELFGHNTLALADPQGHAEMNAIRRAVRVLRRPEGERPAALAELAKTGVARIRRTARGDAPRTEVFSTLEPCPMCTVAIINAGVEAVTFAHEDPLAGALDDDRRARLGPLWGRIADEQGLRARCCQSEREDERSTYVPDDLLRTLVELFEGTREPLDKRLMERGFFRPEELVAAASELSREGMTAQAP
jgi:tRNA(Arg) A34 adenosine deaminase TadA